VKNRKREDLSFKQNSQKLMVQALKVLQQKSANALEMAKNQILNERIETKKAREALKYYVKNWNDTTHPGILALACEAVGEDAEKVMPMQIIMLYLTAAMDLHDDIIDQSKVKNSKPTVFGKYGKDISLLLGNAMMIKGFTLLCDYSKELAPKTFEHVVQAIQTNLFDVGNAHLLEVDFKGKVDLPPRNYLSIIEKKSSVMEAHTKIGATIGGGSLDEIKALTRYGKILGLLISLREEIIDIFEPKELKNRMKNEILPLPLLCTFKNPKIKSEVLNILSKPRISNKDADKIAEYTFRDKNAKKLKDHMKILADEALQIVLTTVKHQQPIDNLTILIDGSLEDI
jgi:geranylgeranyl pyrophosphate synthase